MGLKVPGKCPRVKGMHPREEFLVFNNVGTAKIEGLTPVKLYNKRQTQYSFSHCFYYPVAMDCGGEFELTLENPTAKISSTGVETEDRVCNWIVTAPKGTQMIL